MRATAEVVAAGARRALRFVPFLVWFCLLPAAPPAQAASIPCVLKIVQLEAGEKAPSYVRCSAGPGGAGLCRGHFILAIDGVERAAFVEALCEYGRVTLGFVDDGGAILVPGPEALAIIEIPRVNTAHADLALYLAPPQLLADSPQSHIDRPILRQAARPIAKVHIEVWTER